MVITTTNTIKNSFLLKKTHKRLTAYIINT